MTDTGGLELIVAPSGNAADANPRLAVLADLLADLSALARQEVIAKLSVEDRVAVAKMLASR